uniref:Uncharacterized protein n=1 Tax=Plectus sambesii TaxID=2011161 RepID=A0A914X9C1_9BILA
MQTAHQLDMERLDGQTQLLAKVHQQMLKLLLHQLVMVLQDKQILLLAKVHQEMLNLLLHQLVMVLLRIKEKDQLEKAHL